MHLTGSPRRDGRIDADEVEQVFKQLGHKCKRVSSRWSGARRLLCQRLGRVHDNVAPQADIDDMIWEVDDDCDKGVTWSEFQAMFSRCRNDKTGGLALAAHCTCTTADCVARRLRATALV